MITAKENVDTAPGNARFLRWSICLTVKSFRTDDEREEKQGSGILKSDSLKPQT